MSATQDTKLSHHPGQWWQRLSLFEKVILANSITLIGEAVIGLWVTSHTLESHHYLIDTTFLVLATVLDLIVNIMILRASFHPLFRLLAAMQAISQGRPLTRVEPSDDPDIGTLACAFNTMLDQLEKVQREQALLIFQAQEEERRRIARELHDETSQMLTAQLIHIEVLGQRLAALPATGITQEERKRLTAELTTLTQLTHHTLDTLRVLAQQLRPSVLDDLGLESALHWLAEDSQQRLHLHVCVEIDKAARQALAHLPSTYETTLFRIAQESLTNIARHARAQNGIITLTSAQNTIILTVADDGCGFDPTQPHTGLGLRGMRERTRLLNGTITFESSPGQGTTVRVTLPLPAQSREKLQNE
jgi:two-component system sensor histidine kinase UhpB